MIAKIYPKEKKVTMIACIKKVLVNMDELISKIIPINNVDM